MFLITQQNCQISLGTKAGRNQNLLPSTRTTMIEEQYIECYSQEQKSNQRHHILNPIKRCIATNIIIWTQHIFYYHGNNDVSRVSWFALRRTVLGCLHCVCGLTYVAWLFLLRYYNILRIMINTSRALLKDSINYHRFKKLIPDDTICIIDMEKIKEMVKAHYKWEYEQKQWVDKPHPQCRQHKPSSGQTMRNIVPQQVVNLTMEVITASMRSLLYNSKDNVQIVILNTYIYYQ